MEINPINPADALISEETEIDPISENIEDVKSKNIPEENSTQNLITADKEKKPSNLQEFIDQELKPIKEKSAIETQEKKAKELEEYKKNLSKKDFTKNANLRALNKITAHVSTLKIEKLHLKKILKAKL